MPASTRPSKKAEEIFFAILGKPEDGKKKKKRDLDKCLDFEETARVR